MKKWAIAVAVLGPLLFTNVASAGHRTRCAPTWVAMASYAPCGDVGCGFTYVTTYQPVTRTVCEYFPVTTMQDRPETVVTPVRKTVPMVQTYYENVWENVPMARNHDSEGSASRLSFSRPCLSEVDPTRSTLKNSLRRWCRNAASRRMET